ncbi:hypothetical protein [Arsenicicoccus dermatophilus]|uniref:hypothetical protein n=1 Tax=Arsenicicoccus dermatophilus TaxID=1076331 RepID=UPI0039172A32
MTSPTDDRAFTALSPGPMTHPGPRANRWLGPAVRPGSGCEAPLGQLVRILGWGPDHHLEPGTGRPTRLRRRGAPSAGACQPVQWHVACGRGFDLPVGHHVLDPDTGSFTRRASGPERGATAPGRARVTLTALPRRTAARYHHRAAPCVIGDAAYAYSLLRAGLTGAGVPWQTVRADAAALARAVGLPDVDTWSFVWPGSAPETALLAVEIRAGTTDPDTGVEGDADPLGIALPVGLDAPAPSWIPGIVDLGVDRPPPLPQEPPPPLSYAVLRTRRSPDPRSLTDRTRAGGAGTAHGRPPLGPWCSGQHWIDGCRTVRLYHAEPDPAQQWQAHHQAALDLTRALATGRGGRPVSGWVHGPVHGHVSHALVLEDA